MKSFLLLFFKKDVLFLLFLSCSPAFAQTALNLSVTGQAAVTPDQISAALTAQGNSQNLATAQNEVNAAMAAALKLAKTVSGVTATTSNDTVSQNQPDNGAGPITYQASQELDLVMPAPGGMPPDAFAGLLGKLQNKGFALQNFDGGLSADARRAATQAAMADALRQMKAQAAFVAGQMGESVGRVETLTVGLDNGGPVPMGAPAMMAARAFTPPQAAPASVQVSATVTAVIDLTRSH